MRCQFKPNCFVFLLLTVFFTEGAICAVNGNAVVLMYHRFDESKYPSTNIKTRQFVAQLDYLQANDFRVWPLQRIVSHIKQQKPMPDKVVAITIDDAYASVYAIAYPILKRRNLPFTLFVATRPVARSYANYMSWAQLKELVQDGVHLGNHSHSHQHLIERKAGESQQQWEDRIRQDIQLAADEIWRHTGFRVGLFAYPYGEYDLALAQLVQNLGYVGFGQQSGPFDANSDRRFLPRFPQSESYAGLKDFGVKLKTLVLPIERVAPLNPVTDSGRPLVEIRLKPFIRNRQQLHCYVSQQGEAEVRWLDEQTFQVQARQSIFSRRSRYNCTMPVPARGGFYWYSHIWIQLKYAEP